MWLNYISGIRILDGRVTDRLEAKALLYNNDEIDIMSASWGPHDNGCTMEGPKQACLDALREGATKVSWKLTSFDSPWLQI